MNIHHLPASAPFRLCAIAAVSICFAVAVGFQRIALAKPQRAPDVL